MRPRARGGSPWSWRPRDPVGPVLVGDPGEEARRVDAALGGEPDQAAGELVVGRHRRDEHRVVELRNELLECLFG